MSIELGICEVGVSVGVTDRRIRRCHDRRIRRRHDRRIRRRHDRRIRRRHDRRIRRRHDRRIHRASELVLAFHKSMMKERYFLHVSMKAKEPPGQSLATTVAKHRRWLARHQRSV